MDPNHYWDNFLVVNIVIFAYCVYFAFSGSKNCDFCLLCIFCFSFFVGTGASLEIRSGWSIFQTWPGLSNRSCWRFARHAREQLEKCFETHCSKSSFFVQKSNFDFPRKLSTFGVKNSWKCCGFGLFSCWQFWFHEEYC